MRRFSAAISIFGDTVGLTHAHDLVRGQGAAAHAALVATAVHLRFQANAGFAAHKQSANAFGTVGFVGGQAHQIDRQFGQIKGNAASGLRSVHVEDDALFTAQRTNGASMSWITPISLFTNITLAKWCRGEWRP
jgi:hypothetical protein